MDNGLEIFNSFFNRADFVIMRAGARDNLKSARDIKKEQHIKVALFMFYCLFFFDNTKINVKAIAIATTPATTNHIQLLLVGAVGVSEEVLSTISELVLFSGMLVFSDSVSLLEFSTSEVTLFEELLEVVLLVEVVLLLVVEVVLLLFAELVLLLVVELVLLLVVFEDVLLFIVLSNPQMLQVVSLELVYVCDALVVLGLLHTLHLVSQAPS